MGAKSALRPYPSVPKRQKSKNRVLVVIIVVIAQLHQHVTLWLNAFRVYFEVFFKTVLLFFF